MITQVMVQPSSFMRSGVEMSQFGDVFIFKFTVELQSRLEHLLILQEPIYLVIRH